MKRLVLVGDGRFRTFRNLWALEELGVQYEQKVCFPRSTEATDVNPFGKVPSLIDYDIDDNQKQKPFVMYESAAINTYLGDKYRSSPTTTKGGVELVPPAGTTQRGLYEQLCYCIMTEIDAQGLWIHRKHKALAKVFGSCPEAVDHAFDHTLNVVRTLTMEHLLKSSSATIDAATTTTVTSSSYLLGESFTAADILFVHCLDWADQIGWMSKWMDENSNDKSLLLLKDVYLPLCKERPAYQRTTKIVQENRAAAQKNKL